MSANFVTGHSDGEEQMHRLHDAAERGGASLYGTGISPGYVNALALTLAGAGHARRPAPRHLRICPRRLTAAMGESAAHRLPDQNCCIRAIASTRDIAWTSSSGTPTVWMSAYTRSTGSDSPGRDATDPRSGIFRWSTHAQNSSFVTSSWSFRMWANSAVPRSIRSGGCETRVLRIRPAPSASSNVWSWPRPPRVFRTSTHPSVFQKRTMSARVAVRLGATTRR
jgi:hypothetical protein